MGVNRHVFIRGASPKPRPGKAAQSVRVHRTLHLFSRVNSADQQLRHRLSLSTPSSQRRWNRLLLLIIAAIKGLFSKIKVD